MKKTTNTKDLKLRFLSEIIIEYKSFHKKLTIWEPYWKKKNRFLKFEYNLKHFK